MKDRRIEVRYQGQPVGQLATNGRQTLFQYDPGWIRTGHELAPLTMKRRSTAPMLGTLAGFHYLPPLFSDSLPDAYGRRIMEAWFKARSGPTYTPTPLDMLGYVGETGMGALTYHPAANSFPDKIYRALDLRAQGKLARAVESVGMADGEFVEQARRAAHTVGGAYPKILCAENVQTGQLFEDDPRVGRGFRRWIVKLAQETRPYCGEIEFLFNRLATTAGISVPDAKLIVSTDEKGRKSTHFAIERFDCEHDKRIHFSSLASLLGRPASELTIDYGDLFSVTHELTRDASRVEEAYRRMVFNVAVFNTDDHAKNHAFLYREGKWSLSPAFDVNFCPGTPGAEAVRAMPLLGTSTSITLSLMLRAGERAGISRACAIADEVLTAVIEVRKNSAALEIDLKPLASVLDQIVEHASSLRPAHQAPSERGVKNRSRSFASTTPADKTRDILAGLAAVQKTPSPRPLFTTQRPKLPQNKVNKGKESLPIIEKRKKPKTGGGGRVD